MLLEYKYTQSCILLISALFISLAWLWPNAYYPWLSYTQDLFCFLAISTLFLLCLNKKLNLPLSFLFFLGVSCIPLIQYSFGLIYYISDAILITYYLLFFCLAYLIGCNLSFYIDRSKILFLLACMIGGTAIISAILSVLQFFELNFSFIRGLKGHRIYANFGQPNNMATFHFMGLIALLYLNYVKRLHNVVLLLITALLVFSIVLSQSRAVWLSYILVIFLTMIYFRNKIFILKLMTIGLMYVGLNIVFSVLKTPAVLERGISSNGRLDIWQHMLFAIGQSSWLGYGWYQTSIAQLEGVLLFKNAGYLSSAHNIILDLILWNGIPLALVIIITCFFILISIFYSLKNSQDFILFLCIVPILGHSLLEFPLFYAFFLIPFAFILGLFSAHMPSILTLKQDTSKLIFLVLIVVFAYSYQQIYITMNRLSAASFFSESNQKLEYPEKIYLLNKMSVQEQWLLLDPFTKMDADRIQFFKNFVIIKPTYYNLMKFSQLLAYNNRKEEARKNLNILNALYSKTHTEDELLRKIDFKGSLIISQTN
ncbi:PglL family O-oligosaccharyltransferase [Acinetobacter johnsonii]|uniref:PglL family O-oligosaccharyltransferase n=1 Tax=Acinetobacter johnsonii TaxID=40214 RepID=UPI00376F38D6